MTEPVDTTNANRDTKVVFEREGTRYTLSRVFTEDARVGVEVLGVHPAD